MTQEKPLIRHHVREHSRRGRTVTDYQRGSGSRTAPYSGRYSGPLTFLHRKMLPDSDFAVILKDGTRKYPIENEAHARNALSRVDRFGNSEEKRMVREAVARRYPHIKQSKGEFSKVGRIADTIGVRRNIYERAERGGGSYV